MHAQTQSRSFSVERKSERRPFKPKAWSHQDELKAAVGKVVVLRLVDQADPVIGTLMAADAFALSIRVGNSQSTRTYYKHALVSYVVEA